MSSRNGLAPSLSPPGESPKLDDSGYVLLGGFLNGAETARIRNMVDAALGSPHEAACVRPNNMLLPLRWNDPIVQIILGSDRRIAELIGALGADDLRWISGYISVKEARSPALWWHSDWWCWDHPVSFRRPAAQVAVLTYLENTSAANGALRVLTGSHHKSAAIHAILPEAHSKAAEELPPDHESLRDLPEEVTIAVTAGDAVAIDYRLLHGTHPNPSGTRRDCLLLSFTPSWGRLPDDVKGHLIQHPALPGVDERAPAFSTVSKLLPRFDGARRSLELNRNAPTSFAISDGS